MTTDDVRVRLVDALRLDLVGPEPEDAAYQEETLETAPSQQYLGGFLVPQSASATQRGGDEADEQLDVLVAPGAGDDEEAPEAPAAIRKGLFPSSLGLSFLCAPSTRAVEVVVSWGDYRPVSAAAQAVIDGAGGPDDEEEGEEGTAEGGAAEVPTALPPSAKSPRPGTRGPWRRLPHSECVVVPLGERTTTTPVPGSAGLKLVTSVRPVTRGAAVPAGTLAVSLFLVNDRTPAPDRLRDAAYLFQGALRVRCAAGFVPRPDLRGQDGAEWDGQVADLQYRDVVEYAVGHNISVTASEDADGRCREVRTTWVPTATVEKVVPAVIPQVETSMERLAEAKSAAEVTELLGGLLAAYDAWIAAQAASLGSDGARAEVAQQLLKDAALARGRIQAGLQALADPQVLLAFCLANRAIAQALRQRALHDQVGKEPAAAPNAKAPHWYPFQLAFLLLNLAGLCDAQHPDRQVVDLLFFPTGGGKTEAYLGLAAVTLLLRRLRNPGPSGCGVSVLMRYTLRLLTLDQLGRAATLVCALELLRQEDPGRLGTWPFEIGLWVGLAATPNRMGKRGDNDDYSARARTVAYQNDDKRRPAPIPIESCPWCGERFTKDSFLLYPKPETPLELRVKCRSRRCPFNGNKQSLPLVAVDEPLYRRLPCFLIATVDKFAGLPYVGQTGALFGRVERFDAHGFYGPADPGLGKPLPGGRLPPPDLIIQDELHLISGPLGTMAGLYETAIDALCSTTPELQPGGPRPKIIASTATVRRAERQIEALFCRDKVAIFPPPGPDRRDSFFARTASVTERSPRLYVGLAAPGRSLKVVLLRTYLALLGAAQRAWEEAGGAKNAQNPADPYMTLLGYFNSLRELGGSRRIVEDEIDHRLARYSTRRRVGEARGAFADRKIEHLPLELTSRVSTDQVARTKQRLALGFGEKERVDVALATNMISVGLDITRLGLLVVLGQPKTTAEYIQATSRVGRDDKRPGLVVTLLNVYRPRDRSHYERFCTFHRSFYRAVEATSVTPFSPRAVDRGLAGVTVALARHGNREMTAASRAIGITARRGSLDFVAEVLGQRAERHDKLPAAEGAALRQRIKARTGDLLDVWEALATEQSSTGSGLQYAQEEGSAPPLLYQPTDPALQSKTPQARKFKAARSLRDVEPSVNLWVRTPDGVLVEGGDAEGNS